MKACEQGREMISSVFKMSSLTGNRVNRSGVKLELNTIKRHIGQISFFICLSIIHLSFCPLSLLLISSLSLFWARAPHFCFGGTILPTQSHYDLGGADLELGLVD